MKTKDELRVQRSIDSIYKKIVDSMERTGLYSEDYERKFEEKVRSAGLIYFP